MNKLKFTSFFTALAVMAITITSCNKDDDGSSTTDPNTLTEEQTAILTNYADNIVVANYVELASNGKALLNSVEAIQASTDADKTSLISAAAQAWEKARITWERTEAYLFGPVDKAGIDPGIDSWPLSLPDLQKTIQDWNTDSEKTYDYSILKAYDGSLKGFHAIEYMLFANGIAKTTSIASFDDEYEIEKGALTAEVFEDNLEGYLVAVTEELYRCVLQLEAEWNQAGLSSDKKADLDKFIDDENINIITPNGEYAEIFKTPGLNNVFYTSFNSAIEEAILGAAGIAEEVADVKISDPINAEIEAPGTGLLEVESWFSYNSIDDFTNNVRGIKEAYFGELCEDEATFDADTTPAANSIGAYIASKDAAKGEAIITALNDAIAKVGAMTSPFRNNLSWSSSNTAAKNAVAAVQAALEDAQTVL